MFQKLAITIALFAIILMVACSPTPQAHAIKRESLIPDEIIMPISLNQALDMSLAYGDGRLVDWRAVEV